MHEVSLLRLAVSADPSLGLVLDGAVPPRREEDRPVRAGNVQTQVAAFETSDLDKFHEITESVVYGHVNLDRQPSNISTYQNFDVAVRLESL